MKNIFKILFFSALLLSCERDKSCMPEVGDLYRINILESYEKADKIYYNPFFGDTIEIIDKLDGWVVYSNYYDSSFYKKSIKWNYPIKRTHYCPETNFCENDRVKKVRKKPYKPKLIKKESPYLIKDGIYFDNRIKNKLP